MRQVLLILVHRHLFFDVSDKSYLHLCCLDSSQLVAKEYYVHLHCTYCVFMLVV